LIKREREVLSLISEGVLNKQGAMRMRISPRTFKSHRAEAMRKPWCAKHGGPRPHGAVASGCGVALRVAR
jgi:Bacterial regulatory proteins, luxR family